MVAWKREFDLNGGREMLSEKWELSWEVSSLLRKNGAVQETKLKKIWLVLEKEIFEFLSPYVLQIGFSLEVSLLQINQLRCETRGLKLKGCVSEWMFVSRTKNNDVVNPVCVGLRNEPNEFRANDKRGWYVLRLGTVSLGWFVFLWSTVDGV